MEKATLPELDAIYSIAERKFLHAFQAYEGTRLRCKTLSDDITNESSKEHFDKAIRYYTLLDTSKQSMEKCYAAKLKIAQIICGRIENGSLSLKGYAGQNGYIQSLVLCVNSNWHRMRALYWVMRRGIKVPRDLATYVVRVGLWPHRYQGIK